LVGAFVVEGGDNTAEVPTQSNADQANLIAAEVLVLLKELEGAIELFHLLQAETRATDEVHQ
jgi:hypothetical protein